jgi:hypothetical protein
MEKDEEIERLKEEILETLESFISRVNEIINERKPGCERIDKPLKRVLRLINFLKVLREAKEKILREGGIK